MSIATSSVLLLGSCRDCDCEAYKDSVNMANAQRERDQLYMNEAGQSGAQSQDGYDNTRTPGQGGSVRPPLDGKSPLDTTRNDPGGNRGAYPNNKPGGEGTDVGSGNLNNTGTPGGTKGAVGSTGPTGTQPR